MISNNKQIEIKLPIYIKEFIYGNKILKDVLIIFEEQLQVCLQDRYYGDVFKEVIKQLSCKPSLRQEKRHTIDNKQLIKNAIGGQK